jgi:hypothetical protein
MTTPKRGRKLGRKSDQTTKHAKEKRGDYSPLVSTRIVSILRLLVQFHGVARVYVFEREDDHG